MSTGALEAMHFPALFLIVHVPVARSGCLIIFADDNAGHCDVYISLTSWHLRLSRTNCTAKNVLRSLSIMFRRGRYIIYKQEEAI